MDGDLMMGVRGNDVVLCSSGLTEAFAGEYLRLLFERAELDDNFGAFELLKVADVEKTQQVALEGVRSVSLDAALYEEAIRELDEATVRQRLGGSVRNWFSGFFEEDPDLEELQQGENISAKLVIAFDGRRLGGERGQQKLESIADRLIEEDESGYTIETRRGTKIRANELSLRKQVNFRPYGKTISHQSAWDEIGQYIIELGQSGALEH